MNQPIQVEGRSRIDSWQTLEKSAQSTKYDIVNRPIQVEARSRIDTWQISKNSSRSIKKQLVNRPIQVQGKSRIDTWQTSPVRRRAHSATEVGHLSVKMMAYSCFHRCTSQSMSLARVVLIPGGHLNK